MKKRIFFVFFTIFLLLFGIGGCLYIYMNKPTHLIAHIYQNGQCIKSIDLDEVKEAYTFDITSTDGHINTIEVHPGEIGIIKANCPDKVCVRMGFIHNDLLPISCLPNKLVIHIESKESFAETTPKLDAIVH